MYWKTNDEKVLRSQFDKYEFMITAFTDALNEMKSVTVESPISLADRVEEMLKKKFGNVGDKGR